MIVLKNSAVPETTIDSHTTSSNAGSSAAMRRKASIRPLAISSILPSPILRTGAHALCAGLLARPPCPTLPRACSSLVVRKANIKKAAPGKDAALVHVSALRTQRRLARALPVRGLPLHLLSKSGRRGRFQPYPTGRAPWNRGSCRQRDSEMLSLSDYFNYCRSIALLVRAVKYTCGGGQGVLVALQTRGGVASTPASPSPRSGGRLLLPSQRASVHVGRPQGHEKVAALVVVAVHLGLGREPQ